MKPFASAPFGVLGRIRSTAIVDWLDALVAYVATEIDVPLYPFSRPERYDGPVILYTPGIDVYGYTHDGIEPWVSTPLTIEANASDPDDARALDEAVRTVLEGYRGFLLGNRIDLVKSGLTTFRVGADSRRKWRVSVLTEYTVLRTLREVRVA